MKILGYNYRLIQKDEVEFIGAFGRHHSKSLTIQIAVEICEQQRVSTILHEIIEALDYHLQLSLPHPAIMSLEAGLYQVLIEAGIDLSPLAKEIGNSERKQTQVI